MDLDVHTPQRDYEVIEWEGRAPRVAPTSIEAGWRDIDPTEVWMINDRQLRYWTAELGVTIYEIRDAIAATGTRCAAALRQYLARRHEA